MYALVVVLMINNVPQVQPVWLFRSERECQVRATVAHGKCMRVLTDDPMLEHGIEVLTEPDVVEPVERPDRPKSST